MDAERLVIVSRRALAQSRSVPDIVAEAWQAQALAQAIGGRLAVYGPPELRGDARGLSESGGRGVGALDHPGVRSGGIRAARMSGVAGPRQTLLVLGELLEDVGMALVGVACATDEESLYWQCIEAMDAADESNDRVHSMLRKIAAREAGRPPDSARERAGPAGTRPGRTYPAGNPEARGMPRPPSGAPRASGIPTPPGSSGPSDSFGSFGPPGPPGPSPGAPRPPGLPAPSGVPASCGRGGSLGTREVPDAVDSAAGPA